jgi:neutral trehalase
MWRQRAHWMARRIHQHLWDDEVGFYFDRRHDGRLSSVLAASGFIPLLLADLPAVRLHRLLEHLDDPTTFGAPFPVPSVALNDANWSTDMWRGATWVNLNALIIEGLRRHGATDSARQLAERTVEQVGRYYEQYGVLFEFYDASDRVSPVDCDRKGKRRPPYDIRHKMDSIRDYHWTAALVAWLLLEDQRHHDPRSTTISETIGAQ